MQAKYSRQEYGYPLAIMNYNVVYLIYILQFLQAQSIQKTTCFSIVKCPRRRASFGVGTMVDQELESCIKSANLVCDRITVVRFKINRGSLSVIGVHALDNGKEEESD